MTVRHLSSHAFGSQMHTTSSRSLYLALIIVAALAVSLSLSFPPIQQVRDSLYWARVVDEGTNLYALLNPHHLGYLPLLRTILLLTYTVCPECNAIHVAQWLGVVSYAIAAISILLLTTKLSRSTIVSIGLSIVLIASRNMWVHSMQVSPYVPMVGALFLLALAVATHGPHLPQSRTAVVLVSAPFAVAVLLHQAAVLIGFALAVYLLSAFPPRVAAKTLLRIGIFSGLPVLLCYVVAFALIFGIDALSFGALTKYMTRYATINDPIFASFANFTFEGLNLLLLGQLENFLVPPWALRSYSLIVFGLLLLALVGWNVVMSTLGDHAALRLFFVSWLVLMLAFTLWASPRDDVSKLLNLVPIFGLAAFAIGDIVARLGERKHPFALPATAGAMLLGLAAALATRTLAEDVKPLHLELGQKYESASLAAQAVPATCRIIDVDQEVLMNLYFYFDRDGLDGWDLITWFYYGRPEAVPWTWENFRFSGHSCLAIKGAFVKPSIAIKRGVDGHSQPEKWYAFLEWFIGIDYEDGRVAGMRCLDSVLDAQDAPYLLVHVGERCAVSGLRRVMTTLDAHLSGPQTSSRPGDFEAWFLENEQAIIGFRRQPLRDRLRLGDATMPSA